MRSGFYADDANVGLDPPHGATVLDVGCGVGEVARLMSQCRPDLQFILLNISASQLALCPPYPRLRAAVEKIPLRVATVDAVLACYVLGHVDQLVALNALRRVLRPGGVLSSSTLQAAPYPSWTTPRTTGRARRRR